MLSVLVQLVHGCMGTCMQASNAHLLQGVHTTCECSKSVEAGGITWAYRRADPPEGVSVEGKLPVLLLHGLGSHSFCYRDLMRLLADKGHVCFAPDWPGHGASSKVCSQPLSLRPCRQVSCSAVCTMSNMTFCSSAASRAADDANCWRIDCNVPNMHFIMRHFTSGLTRVQPESGFAYDQSAYLKGLDSFIDAVGLKDTEFAVATHGFVLGQFGMLWALQHSDEVAGLIALGVPLGLKTNLRPELAAYKAAMPFMRPKPDGKFPGDTYNAAGLAYFMSARDAEVCATLVALGMRAPPRCLSNASFAHDLFCDCLACCCAHSTTHAMNERMNNIVSLVLPQIGPLERCDNAC